MRCTFAQKILSLVLFLFLLSACQTESNSSTPGPASSTNTTASQLFPFGILLDPGIQLTLGAFTTPFNSADVAPRDVVLDHLGRTLVAGRYTASGQYDDFFLARYNPDGSFDSSFASTGYTHFGFGTGGDLAHAVALQPDGKIVVVGRTDPLTNAYFDFGIARVNEDGSFDTSFNGTGKTTFSMINDDVGSTDIARAVQIQSDGKILVSGYSRWPHHTYPYHFAVIRLLSDGTLDSGFGTGGRVITATDTNDNLSYGMTIQTDQKTVLVGAYNNGSHWKISLVRYNTDGSLDTSFNGSGILKFSASAGDDIPYHVEQDPEGRLVIAGETDLPGTTDALFARILSDGTLDSSFGTGGITLIPNANGDIRVNSVKVDWDSSLVAVGTADDHSISSFAVVRLDPSGNLMESFGTNGVLERTFFGVQDVAQSMACTSDGTCIAAGRSQNGSVFDAGLMQFDAR